MENKVVQHSRTVEDTFVLTGGGEKHRRAQIFCRETLHSNLILTEPRCYVY